MPIQIKDELEQFAEASKLEKETVIEAYDTFHVITDSSPTQKNETLFNTIFNTI
jgi:hypothetical protein